MNFGYYFLKQFSFVTVKGCVFYRARTEFLNGPHHYLDKLRLQRLEIITL
jgi:hypothetical protein